MKWISICLSISDTFRKQNGVTALSLYASLILDTTYIEEKEDNAMRLILYSSICYTCSSCVMIYILAHHLWIIEFPIQQSSEFQAVIQCVFFLLGSEGNFFDSERKPIQGDHTKFTYSPKPVGLGTTFLSKMSLYWNSCV